MKFLKSKTRQGESFILAEAILWSLFPVIVILSLSQISHFFSLAWSTLFSAIFFFGLVTFQGKWKDSKKLHAWKDILLSTLLLGIIFYVLFFWALTKTTAGNAMIVSLMEIFFSFLFFEFFLKEKSPRTHIFGAVFMVMGALMVIFPGKLNFNWGDIIILLAVAIGPFGHYFQRKARKEISSGFLMFVRSVISSIFLFGLAFLVDTPPEKDTLEKVLPLLAFNGILILGLSKIFWIEAIHRIPVQKAISMNSIVPAFTLFFAYFLLGETPTIWQIMGFIPIVVGGILITQRK